MKKPASRIAAIKKHGLCYAMLLPGMIVTFLFAYMPLGGLYIAFSDYKLGKPIYSAQFAGLKYFKQVFSSASGLDRILWNTIGMNLLSLLIGMISAMLFAVLLNEIRNGGVKKVVQTASFFPFFVSWVIVYNIVNTFFASESGVINVALVKSGLISKGINVLGSPRYSWALIILTSLWKSLGYNSILFMSSITGIDQNLYEAAAIDGADRLQKIWYITIPALLPTLQILLIMNVGWILGSNFDQFYMFTNTMNKSTMTVFDLHIYNVGLKSLKYSFAAAVGILKSIAGVVMLLVVNGISSKLSDTSVI